MMGNPTKRARPIPNFICNRDVEIEKDKKLLKSKTPNLVNMKLNQLALHQWKLEFVVHSVKNREAEILQVKKQIHDHDSLIKTKKTSHKAMSESIQNDTTVFEETKKHITQTIEDIAKLKLEQERLEKAVESKRCFMRDKQIAFGRGIDFFKLRLQCYLQIDGPKSTDEECTFVLYFFTSEKPENKADNFVKLNRSGDNWKLLETKPQLANQAALAKKLSETADIQGFLCLVQKQFQELKTIKRE